MLTTGLTHESIIRTLAVLMVVSDMRIESVALPLKLAHAFSMHMLTESVGAALAPRSAAPIDGAFLRAAVDTVWDFS